MENNDLKLGNFQDLVDKYDDGLENNDDLPMFGSALNKKKTDAEININLNNNNNNNNIFTTEDDLNNNENNNNNDKESKKVLNNSFGEMNNNIQIDVGDDSTFNENNNNNNNNNNTNNKNKSNEDNNYNILNEEDIKNNYKNEKNTIEEYQDDEDPGYDLYECDIEYFADTCQKLSEDNGFPHRGVYKSKYRNYKPVKIPFIKPKKKRRKRQNKIGNI